MMEHDVPPISFCDSFFTSALPSPALGELSPSFAAHGKSSKGTLGVWRKCSPAGRSKILICRK